jgi:hypothetical protein
MEKKDENKDEEIKRLKAAEIIARDPIAYTYFQKNQLPYLEFQKLLATNEKTQKKISSRIIKKYLYG